MKLLGLGGRLWNLLMKPADSFAGHRWHWGNHIIALRQHVEDPRNLDMAWGALLSHMSPRQYRPKAVFLRANLYSDRHADPINAG